MKPTREMNAVEAEVRKDVWMGRYEEVDRERCRKGYEQIIRNTRIRLGLERSVSNV